MANFADNCKNLRATYKLTQEELANIAGVSVTAVSKWEIGRSLPRMGALEKMSQHFGLTKSDIIEGTFIENEKRIDLFDMLFAGRPELRSLFNLASNSSRDEIEKTIKVMEVITGKTAEPRK